MPAKGERKQKKSWMNGANRNGEEFQAGSEKEDQWIDTKLLAPKARHLSPRLWRNKVTKKIARDCLRLSQRWFNKEKEILMISSAELFSDWRSTRSFFSPRLLSPGLCDSSREFVSANFHLFEHSAPQLRPISLPISLHTFFFRSNSHCKWNFVHHFLSVTHLHLFTLLFTADNKSLKYCRN